MLPALVAMKYGIKGWVSGSSMASAGGSVAIGEAFRMIKSGYMDRVLVGGLDLNVNTTVVNGMDAFSAVTKFKGDADQAMRPFDKDRSGTIMSDGGALILLET
jgi:3-oxoacyl-[acyl-carrier-protein] synthase II